MGVIAATKQARPSQSPGTTRLNEFRLKPEQIVYGGEQIGRGSFGAVFQGALQCEHSGHCIHEVRVA